MNPADPFDAWKIAQILMGILLAVLSWLGVRLHARVDNSVSKEDFRDALSTLRVERDAQHKENREERLRLHQENVVNFKELASKMDKQLVHEQRISQCERDLTAVTRYAEELKHVNVDPYIRLTAVLESRVKALEGKA